MCIRLWSLCCHFIWYQNHHSSSNIFQVIAIFAIFQSGPLLVKCANDVFDYNILLNMAFHKIVYAKWLLDNYSLRENKNMSLPAYSFCATMKLIALRVLHSHKWKKYKAYPKMPRFCELCCWNEMVFWYEMYKPITISEQKKFLIFYNKIF